MTHFSIHAITAAVLTFAASGFFAHEDHCIDVAKSVAKAGFDDRVSFTCTASHAIIQLDTYPEHEKITGIVGTNEQVPVSAD